MEKKRQITERLIVGGMILVALLFAVVFRFMPAGEKVKITYDGAEYGTYSLERNRKIEVETELGRNVVVIEKGVVHMEEASCPDKICMHMTPLSAEVPGLIVCLPNKVIVELTK